MKNSFPLLSTFFIDENALTFSKLVLSTYNTPGIKDKGNNTDSHLG